MEPDYFKNYLQDYVRNHGFGDAAALSDKVLDNADLAKKEYDDCLNAGYDGMGALELALRTLFIGIGDSSMEAADYFLEDTFIHIVPEFENSEVYDEWVRKVAENEEIWKDYRIENGLGLDKELLETNRYEIIGSIDQFLKENGIQ